MTRLAAGVSPVAQWCKLRALEGCAASTCEAGSPPHLRLGSRKWMLTHLVLRVLEHKAFLKFLECLAPEGVAGAELCHPFHAHAHVLLVLHVCSVNRFVCMCSVVNSCCFLYFRICKKKHAGLASGSLHSSRALRVPGAREWRAHASSCSFVEKAPKKCFWGTDLHAWASESH